MTTQRTVGVGIGSADLAGNLAGELSSADMVLNIGPQHPSTHGVLRLRLVARRRAHRHAPSRSSATCTAARRSCSRSATTGRSSCSPTGTTGCPRSPTSSASCSPSSGCSAWRCRSARSGLRTLLAELNRVLNHLMFLGSYPLEIGAITPIFYAFRERETLQARDGGGLRRPHALHVQPGRRPQGGPAGRLDSAGRAAAVAEVRSRMPDLDDLIRGNEIFRARTRGVGVLTAGSRSTRTASAGRSPAPPASTSTCAGTSRTSPTASCRTCSVVTRDEGDCLARFECLLDQVYVSLDLADACLDRLADLPPGPSTCGCRRCSRRPRATRTPGPRTRSASTATTWCPAARRRRGG